MKTRLIMFVSGSSLLLAVSSLWAQGNLSANYSTSGATNISENTSTNVSATTATNSQPRKYQRPFTGEQLVLSAETRAKLKLEAAQQAGVSQIEDDFAITCGDYKTANQPRIDAANEAIRRALPSKDKTQIQAARAQSQEVWAGLQRYRADAVTKIKPLLTPAQLKILEDPKNGWQEDPAVGGNDISANGILDPVKPR